MKTMQIDDLQYTHSDLYFNIKYLREIKYFSHCLIQELIDGDSDIDTKDTVI